MHSCVWLRSRSQSISIRESEMSDSIAGQEMYTDFLLFVMYNFFVLPQGIKNFAKIQLVDISPLVLSDTGTIFTMMDGQTN